MLSGGGVCVDGVECCARKLHAQLQTLCLLCFNVFRCERVPHDRSIILTNSHLRPFAPTPPRLRSGKTLHLRWEWEKDIFSADWDVSATLDDNSANAQLRLLTMRKTMVAVVLVPSRHTDSATLRARWGKAATQLALRDFRNIYICYLDVHKVGTGGSDRTFDRLAKASTQPLDKEKPGVVLVLQWASFDDDEGATLGPGLDTVERYDGPAYQVKGIVSQMRIVSTPRADVEINDVDLLREKIKMFPTVVHMFLDGSLASFKKTRKRFARVAAASVLQPATTRVNLRLASASASEGRSIRANVGVELKGVSWR